MENLTIYKASAGSGKTFTLTQEFLLLLFKRPEKYRSILAVTFTNKATAEMKNRIINEVFTLAEGALSPYTQLILAQNTSLNELKLKERAKEILIAILQDYSHFSVTTIDKFYQQVIRAFVREMGVNSSYSIELENDEVLEQAIDNLFFNLEDEKGAEIIKWLTRFTKDQVMNGDSWRIADKIKQLGTELFKEQFKTNERKLLDELADKDLLHTMEKSLYSAIKKYENDFLTLGKQGISFIDKAGLSLDDFKYKGSSGINYLFKLASGIIEPYKVRFENLVTDDDSWANNGSSAHEVETARDTGLKHLVKDVVIYCDENIEKYLSLLQLRRNFYNLGILSDIEMAIKAYINEKNLLLLSDSNELIATIINNNDTPFIYEKTGTRFEHYMIDEFQDTSSLQWSNFKPLIDNSLGEAHKNLIVGDVKQSIYRFRNSDWSLLAGKLKNEFRADQLSEKILPINWRSDKNVVAFNNSFFKVASTTLQQIYNEEFDVKEAYFKTLIEEAYSSTCQHLPPNKITTGRIEIQVFDKKNDEWENQTFEKLVSVIEEAQILGYEARDIAILVRRKKEGKAIADRLLAYQQGGLAKQGITYSVLSDEALLIGSSKSVLFIVNILKRVFLKDHALLDVELKQYYLTLTDKNEPYNYERFFANDEHFNITIEKCIQNISYLPLIEQVEAVIHLFKLDKQLNDLAYVQAFSDVIAEFSKKNYSDTEAFIRWWDQKGKTRSVPAPKGQNSIQILTIHKSKGLEFPIVIIPYFDWNFAIEASKAPIAWVDPHELLTDSSSLMPVRCSGALKSTLFKEHFYKEQFLTFVDNLNLAYVAFTRAINGLYIFGQDKGGLSAANILIKCMTGPFNEKIVSSFPHLVLVDHWDAVELTFQIGELSKPVRHKATTQKNMILPKSADRAISNHLRLKLKAPVEFAQDSSSVLSKAEIGIILHELLRKMKSPSDLDELLVQARREGKLGEAIIEPVAASLKRLLKAPLVAQWFAEDLTVYNEMSILTPEGDEYRPDRVVDNGTVMQVIDYKFGVRQLQNHSRQVRQYMHLLERMGHKTVDGYLWYVSLGEVIRVKG